MSNESVRVAISVDDGSLAVMQFMVTGRSPTLPSGAQWIDGQSENWRREPTDANLSAEISKTFAIGPQAVGYRVVREQDIPKDRSFRDAWIDDGAAIVHHMPKARQIHLDRLRVERVRELEQLDRDWMRATGQKDTVEADRIEAQRQQWRDMPQTTAPAIEAATTIDELKAVKP